MFTFPSQRGQSFLTSPCWERGQATNLSLRTGQQRVKRIDNARENKQGQPMTHRQRGQEQIKKGHTSASADHMRFNLSISYVTREPKGNTVICDEVNHHSSLGVKVKIPVASVLILCYANKTRYLEAVYDHRSLCAQCYTSSVYAADYSSRRSLGYPTHHRFEGTCIPMLGGGGVRENKRERITP